MKKCPYCGADIEENARFCLYCMAPLDKKTVVEIRKEKRKTALIIAAIAVAAALLCALIWAFSLLGKDEDANESLDSSAESVFSESDFVSDDESATETDPSDESEAVSDESLPDENSDVASSDDETSDESHDETSDDVKPQYDFPPVHASADITEYSYRDATWQDDLYGSESRTKNGVVITAVNVVSPDGVYIIPETIDGKRVVAILDGAFDADEIRDTVKVLVIPKHVSTIGHRSIYRCYGLTDLYICGEELGSAAWFLPMEDRRTATLTIHCSPECSDRNLRTYKTHCEYYGEALYDEWYNEK